MVIAIGADHAGYHLKEHLKATLAAGGYELVDVGTFSTDSVDYPPIAAQVARQVADGDAERGVIACGSGNGVMIVANKVDGIRAVNAHDVAEVEMARRHNDINVVTLSGSRLALTTADEIVRAFLTVAFEGGRHARRVGEIANAVGRS